MIKSKESSFNKINILLLSNFNIRMLINPPTHFTRQEKRIAFIHPDLGIGGAEQLVVNLCLGVIGEGY